MRLSVLSTETQVIVLFPKANLCNWHHVMQLSRIPKHILSPGYTPTYPHVCTCTHTCAHKHTHTRTLFCFRAPFSFMWGQSLPVITALISATGTAERTEVRTTTTTTLWQLWHPRWVAGLFKWLKVKILPRSVTVHALQVKLMLTPTPHDTSLCHDSCNRPYTVFWDYACLQHR